MNSSEAEYRALRTELIHYDNACLTILGLMLTASTAIYGLVSDKSIYPLLFLLSIIWSVGFPYILDKRASNLKIALYIKIHVESCDNDFFWETWLQNKGLLNNTGNRHSVNEKAKAEYPKGLDDLPIVDPVKIEFALLATTHIVNVAWLWLAKDSQQPLAITTTILAIISLYRSFFRMYHYLSFDSKKFINSFTHTGDLIED